MNRRARAAGWIIAAVVAFVIGLSVGRAPFIQAQQLQAETTGISS